MYFIIIIKSNKKGYHGCRSTTASALVEWEEIKDAFEASGPFIFFSTSLLLPAMNYSSRDFS